MSRRLHILAYVFLLCALAAALTTEILLRDGFRSVVLAVLLFGVLAFRRDLTEPTQ